MNLKSYLYGFFKGISNDSSQVAGTELNLPESEFIVSQGSASNNHIVILFSDGSSMSSGANNKGQLGIGSTSDIVEFKPVTSNEKFNGVSCGEDFTIWTSESRCLYASGVNNYNTPTALNGIHAIRCSAYKNVACAITEKKTVLFWPDFHNIDQYKEYTLLNPALDISCGIDFVSVLLENQTLFQIHSNGNIEPIIVQTSPEKTNDRFIRISSCESYTVAVDFDSNLWLIGQVGRLKSSQNLPPICTDAIDAFALPQSIVVVLTNRITMVLGENKDGQLATGNMNSVYEFVFTKLKYPILSAFGNDRMTIYLSRPLTKGFVKCDQSEFIPGYQKYMNTPDKLI